jgi:lipopolysaccharide/colanic/teichoic acid biosynthesis glycosyltransferase
LSSIWSELGGKGMTRDDVLDSALGIIGLIFYLPTLLVVAVAIKLDSRGPVFLKRRRGYGGRVIYAYMFRTIHVQEDAVQIAKAGPRVTRVGKFLRKTGFDGLPQLINVVRGEISLVRALPRAMALHREALTEGLRRLILGKVGREALDTLNEGMQDALTKAEPTELPKLRRRYLRVWSATIGKSVLDRIMAIVSAPTMID